MSVHTEGNESGPTIEGAFSIKRFCREYDVGRSYVYELIKAGKLRAVKASTRTLILKQDAEAWAEALPAINPAH